jgi:hypothetical protein
MISVIIVIDVEFVGEASRARLHLLGAWIIRLKIKDWPSLALLIIYTCFYSC